MRCVISGLGTAFLMASFLGAQESRGFKPWDLSMSLFWAENLHDSTPRSPWRGLQTVGKLADDFGPLSLRVEGRVRWNMAARSQGFSQEARDAYLFQADLREAYLSMPLSGWTLSMGLQQVVWGKADQLRVMDQVNPLDLQQFYLPDLNDMRIAVPMVRVARMAGEWNLEVLYIPWFTPTRWAKPGSPYEIPLLDPEVAPYVSILPERRPARTLRNGEVGAQVSRSYQGLDLGFFAFHTWDDNAVYRALPPQAPGLPLQLQPEYGRQFMTGASLVNNLGRGFVLRSEVAYVPRATYMDSAQPDGLIRRATLTGLVGLDYLYREWLFSFQASDRYIQGWRGSMAVPERSLIYTLSATGSSFSGRLDTRLAITRFAQNGDGTWFQARNTWKPGDRWAYSAGLDLFSGPRQGIFGQFREKSRAWFETKAQF